MKACRRSRALAAVAGVDGDNGDVGGERRSRRARRRRQDGGCRRRECAPFVLADGRAARVVEVLVVATPHAVVPAEAVVRVAGSAAAAAVARAAAIQVPSHDRSVAALALVHRRVAHRRRGHHCSNVTLERHPSHAGQVKRYLVAK